MKPGETKILGLSYQETWIRPDKKSGEDNSKESEILLKTLKKTGRPQKNWVRVGDRANDIQEFFIRAKDRMWSFFSEGTPQSAGTN